jgi:peptidoglycan/xylan/chitin deacetylase (PgdA/CDA1 family)
MLLKRSIALMVGLLLFIATFIVFFHINDARIEDRFRRERQDFQVDGKVLTAQPPPPAPAPAAAPAAPATPDGGTTNSTPAPAAPTPATSTMLEAPEGRSSFVVLAAYNPATGMRIQMQPAETPASTPLTAPTAPAPAPSNSAPATNVPASPAPDEAATSTPPASSPATTNASSGEAAPAAVRPVPVEASVIVLGYHQFVGPGQSSRNIYVMRQDVFESEMKYLRDNGYHVVPLSDVVRFIKHEIGLPPNSVAITIDDGYKSSIVWAAPVLKAYGYPWTFFVYPEFITPNEGKGAASWNDLLQLQSEGVDIECHSMTHPILTSHTQKFKGARHTLSPVEYDEFLTNETAGAKALLEQKMGKSIPYFAYPYGAYNKMVEAKAIASGYDAIFTVADNPVHSTTDKNAVGRYIITQPVEKAFASYLRQGALSVAEADPAPGTTTSEPRPVITAVLGYAGTIDPKSIETDVRDFGMVRHDFDPKTSTVRLYLQRDLIQPVVIVNIRVKDAETGQVMVANWHFNYEPAGATAPAQVHPPIPAPVPPAASPSTNAAAAAAK